MSPLQRRLITVTGADRPGLIAGISEALANAGADLEDVTMTRLEGNFATILVARGGDTALLESGLEETARRLDLHVHIETAVERTPDDEPDCFISAAGPNRVGIVAAIARVLAQHGVNIIEMSTRLLEKTEVPVYLVRIEAKTSGAAGMLEQDLQRAGRELGIEVRFEMLERTDL
jgi:glycine cleavage system transcriptional repressor